MNRDNLEYLNFCNLLIINSETHILLEAVIKKNWEKLNASKFFIIIIDYLRDVNTPRAMNHIYGHEFWIFVASVRNVAGEW